MASPFQIDMHTAVCGHNPAVAREAVIDQRQSLIAFHVTGSPKEFIEHSVHNIFGRRDNPRY